MAKKIMITLDELMVINNGLCLGYGGLVNYKDKEAIGKALDVVKRHMEKLLLPEKRRHLPPNQPEDRQGGAE